MTSAASGTGFSIGSNLSSNTNVTISDPIVVQGTGKVSVYGTPKFSSVSSGTQDDYHFSLTTNGSLCDSTTVSGTITVTPKSIITAISTPTLSQTVCDDIDITPIGFNYSGDAQGASIAWNPSLPSGINFTFDNTTKTATITGKPDNLNVLTPTDYTYTITTLGNLSGCAEASITGTITVNPNDAITYDPTSGSRNQTLCSGAEITPIRYQLSGGATGATVVGLLDGLGYTVTASKVLVISGKVSPVNAAINNQSFTISTIGSCSPDLTEVTGDFSVYPVSQLSLTSGDPIQNSGVCNDGIEDMTPIIYTWGGGAQTVTITWSPFDPQFDQQSFGVPLKTFQKGGATSANVSVTTIFSYEINTVNANGCSEATTLTGQIEVNPKPIINKVAIESLINNETCFGSTDGSIILPETSSSDFNNEVGLLKFKSEFLQNNVLIFSNLWFSKSSTSSAVISLQSPVMPKLPSLRYLPALPAIWPISDRFSFLNFFPSNFFKFEKYTWSKSIFIPIPIASVATKKSTSPDWYKSTCAFLVFGLKDPITIAAPPFCLRINSAIA